jgi:subfamily B ATP-binding cassette protein MsbA
MKSLRTIFPYLKGKGNYITCYVISSFLAVLFSTLSVAAITPFLNMLFEKEMVVLNNPGLQFTKEGMANYFKYQFTHYIEIHDSNRAYGLLLICILLLTAIFFKNLFLYLSKFVLNPLRNSVVYAIRKKLYNKIISLPVGFFTNERKGDIISRMTNDVSAVEISIISSLELMFSAPLTIIFYLFFLLWLNSKLFLFLLILLPIGGFFIGRITKSLKSQTRNSQEKSGNILSIIEETLGGLRIIKAFKAEDNRAAAFEKENNDLQNLSNSIARKRELASPLSEFMGVTILCIIIWFGGNMVLSKPSELEAGTFIMFIALFYFLISPLKSLSQMFYNIHQGSAGIERINKILEAENKLVDNNNAKDVITFDHEIEFKQVSFYYDEVEILKNLNLKIKKGNTLAIVGASGAGKSTLVDLIPRFHDVSKGELLIDGINVKDISISSLRNLMGIVSQEPILFNDTIANNISLGANEMNMQLVEESAKIANAHEFIINKEEQYNTTTGDRGAKLSGGEKQRVTIARAIYKNPPILILDEATSSLDTVSERMVQEAINNLMKNRTSIVIAHRLSTVQNADEIIVLEQGEIKERGTHQSLLAQNGLYKKLVDMQQLES